LPNETKALARQGLDEALLIPGIADCSPGGIQARRLMYADGGIPLNQRRLCVDLVHEDEWELDEVFSHFIA
jgi:hypothetical protein